MKIVAGNRFQARSLNQLPGDYVSLLKLIGFVAIPSTSGAYGILDDEGKDVIIYDDNSGEFYRIKNGALDDNGETVCRYLNNTDGWEVLLQEHEEIYIDYNINSLEDALGIVSY